MKTALVFQLCYALFTWPLAAHASQFKNYFIFINCFFMMNILMMQKKRRRLSVLRSLENITD